MTAPLHFTLVEHSDGERFIFLWPEDRKGDVLHQAAAWAANPELSFSWVDAGHLYCTLNGVEVKPIECHKASWGTLASMWIVDMAADATHYVLCAARAVGRVLWGRGEDEANEFCEGT